MFSLYHKAAVALIAIAAVTLSAANVQASIAYELIVDAGLVGDVFSDITGLPTDGLARARGYLSPPTIPDIETDDSTVASENSVVNFGDFNGSSTSYVHHLDWLAPPANGVYNSATLYIAAAALYVDGGPTEVFVDSISLGSLDSAVLLSLSSFGIDVSLLADDMLSVEIDKGAYVNRFFTHPNKFAVVGSKLVVDYDPSDDGGVVPEPTTVLVWSGLAILGVAIGRWRLAK